MIYSSDSAQETRNLGREVASKMMGGEVLCLYGDLGTGKTTFTQGFISFFLPGKRVVSPTFIIVRHYPVTNNRVINIYHADFYRLNCPGEIEGTGILDFMHKPENLTIIEWPEKLGNRLPDKRIDLKFETLDEEKRKIARIDYNC